MKFVDKIGVARFAFIVEDLLIAFAYNDSSSNFYKGLVTIAFGLLTLFATYVAIKVVGFVISTWWAAIIVAAFITFITSIFSNTSTGQSFIDSLANTIEANIKKVKKFLKENKDKFFEYFNDGGNLLKKLSECLTKTDFSEKDLENLLTECGYCRANGDAWKDFIQSHFRGKYTINDICNPDGTIKQNYKDERYRAFW